MRKCRCRRCREAREPKWKYTLGADWSDHSVETRLNVERLLRTLAKRDETEVLIRDYDSPIGKFALSRRVLRPGRQRK
jgi:hypothetical protein